MYKLKSYILEEIVKGARHKILNFIFYLFKLGNKNAVLMIRIFQVLSNKNSLISSLLAVHIQNKLIRNYGIELHKRTRIGLGLKIGHANGIILGGGVEIGNNVTIYQQVTIGISSIKEIGDFDAYPVIEDDCVIYSGVKIFGNIRIKRGTVIGANSVVLTDTEENSVYAGIPAIRIK